MSRLNTMYPDDQFLKNISDIMGKLDNKNEREIKQEIEQIGYKEFYRYYKEKDVYIKQLKEEKQEWINLLDMFKTQQKEFINYLEDEIKRINPKELDIGELNIRLNDIKFTQYLIYKEILQKYKEIIGVSDENKTTI